MNQMFRTGYTYIVLTYTSVSHEEKVVRIVKTNRYRILGYTTTPLEHNKLPQFWEQSYRFEETELSS